MDLGDPLGAWVDGKGGRKEIVIGRTNKIGSGLVQERDPHNCIDQRLTSSNKNNATGGTRSWSACESKLEIWNWKYGVGVAGGIAMNTRRGLVALEKAEENCLTKVALDVPQVAPTPQYRNGCMSWALCRVTWSPFSDKIKCAQMLRRFNRLPFISYDGKADPIEHVSRYIQMMSLYCQNDELMCKVFPSSLGPIAIRWFNGLRKGSIHNFGELI